MHPNQQTFETILCLNLNITNLSCLHFFSFKKILIGFKEQKGGGQVNFDIVQIWADILFSLASNNVTNLASKICVKNEAFASENTLFCQKIQFCFD